jgi:hypothetical protein
MYAGVGDGPQELHGAGDTHVAAGTQVGVHAGTQVGRHGWQ